MEKEIPREQRDFYQRLRKRVSNWTKEHGDEHQYSEYVMFAPDLLHCLCKLTVDSDVPSAKKAKVGGAIAYFISPVDVLPEALLGPAGYIDDVALAAHVLDDIVNDVNAEVVKRHWAGDENVLSVIQGILDMANAMMGGGVWEQVKNSIGDSDS